MARYAVQKEPWFADVGAIVFVRRYASMPRLTTWRESPEARYYVHKKRQGTWHGRSRSARKQTGKQDVAEADPTTTECRPADSNLAGSRSLRGIND